VIVRREETPRHAARSGHRVVPRLGQSFICGPICQKGSLQTSIHVSPGDKEKDKQVKKFEQGTKAASLSFQSRKSGVIEHRLIIDLLRSEETAWPGCLTESCCRASKMW
jgi:hypothetical protein